MVVLDDKGKCIPPTTGLCSSTGTLCPDWYPNSTAKWYVNASHTSFPLYRLPWFDFHLVKHGHRDWSAGPPTKLWGDLDSYHKAQVLQLSKNINFCVLCPSVARWFRWIQNSKAELLRHCNLHFIFRWNIGKWPKWEKLNAVILCITVFTLLLLALGHFL